MAEDQHRSARCCSVAVLMIGLLILASILYIWSGSYNIAATEPHFEFVHRGLAMIRDRSIEVRAGKTEAHRVESATAIAGFRPYHEMCSICHAAPGLEADPIQEGLNPKPPLLTSESVQRRSDTELFWIVKHGIKMTGMPAFGPTHQDKELWQIVGFIRRLPQIKAEEYHKMLKAEGKVESDDHGHSHTSTGRPVAPQ
jgi:mono/diheme cytochrome c family protein